MAIKIFIGEQLQKRIQIDNTTKDFSSIYERLAYDKSKFSKDWVDAAGMFITKNEFADLLNSISGQKIKSIDELTAQLVKLKLDYEDFCWAWCANLIESRLNISISDISREQLSQILIDWKDNSVKLNNMILKDAEKEFDQTSKIGFGLDGKEDTRDKDFESVRGTFENNNFVIELKRESDQIIDKTEKLLQMIKSI
jgi:hypothetical protein